MRAFWAMALSVLAVARSAAAADKPTRFWNLTANTITSFQLAPAGTEAWGPDQCRNDRDGSVDDDERLRITGLSPGPHDARFADKTGRICVVRAIEIRQGEVFAIEEKELTECRR